MGKLGEDAGAVTGFGIRAGRAAVFELVQGGYGALNYLVERLAVETSKARDATPIVLVGRVVKTGGPG